MLPGPTCVVFVCPCLAKGGANTGLAMAQEEFEAWRLGAHKTSLIPRTPLAQSVVLETGPQPTPSTAIFAFTPASLQRASYHRSCQEKNLCQLWSGEADPPALQPSPHLEYLSSSGCGPYLIPVLTQRYSQLSSPPPCTSRACVCCLLLFCSLAPFWSAFAFCWVESH